MALTTGRRPGPRAQGGQRFRLSCYGRSADSNLGARVERLSSSRRYNAHGNVFTAEEIARATGGEVLAPGSPGSIVSNSRGIREGQNCWFLALKGKRLDGRDFIPEAVRIGSCCGVVFETEEGEYGTAVSAAMQAVEEESKGLVLVQGRSDSSDRGDGTASLHGLARLVRGRFEGQVVGITGSCGKTTTRTMISHLLRALQGDETVHETEGNMNNLIGLPQTLLKLPPEASYCVLELGMSVFGEIQQLQAICQPSVRVVTNVGLAHLEGVGGTIQGVAKAKAELVSSAKRGDTCVLNMDDSNVAAMRPPDGVDCVYFGHGTDCQVRILNAVACGERGMSTRFALKIADKGVVDVEVCQPGAKQVSANAAAAVATILALKGVDFDLPQLSRALSTYVPSQEGRATVREYSLNKGTSLAFTVIDDTYNANPTSVEAALEMLAESGGGEEVCDDDDDYASPRKHVALGDMLELGGSATKQHLSILRLCVQYLKEDKVHSVGLVGPCFAKELESWEEDRDKVKSKVIWAQDAESLAQKMIPCFGDGDVVLVKGSRSMRMETFLNFLGS